MRLRSRPPTSGGFYYCLAFRETRARDSSEHAGRRVRRRVSLGKTRLPFLRHKNVGIIYDLATGGTYTRTRAWEWTARAPRSGSGLIPAAIWDKSGSVDRPVGTFGTVVIARDNARIIPELISPGN